MSPLLNLPNREALSSRFRAWLDLDHPLPDDVRFYPMRPKGALEYIIPFTVAIFFFLMGIIAPIAFFTQVVRLGFVPETIYLLFGALFIIFFLVVLFYGLLAGPIQDWRLARVSRSQRVRQGIFVANDVILISLLPQLHLFTRTSMTDASLKIVRKGARELKYIDFTLILNGEKEMTLSVRIDQIAADPNLLIQVINQTQTANLRSGEKAR